MLTFHDLAARAEEQKRASPVCTLGLALCQALVPNKRRLLVANQATDGYTSEGSIRNVAVNLRGRDELGQDAFAELEEF
jgi:hypothetical protein